MVMPLTMVATMPVYGKKIFSKTIHNFGCYGNIGPATILVAMAILEIKHCMACAAEQWLFDSCEPVMACGPTHLFFMFTLN